VTDFDNAAVAAAVSVEGRKFLKFVPFDISPSTFKAKFVIGRDAFGSVRCEDIDDFLDALAGGMRASILLHFRRTDGLDSAALWPQAITSVGEAVRQAIDINPVRKGLPPGVKATLV
jgi:imidazoleglycerol phosphate dehydratase HisB